MSNFPLCVAEGGRCWSSGALADPRAAASLPSKVGVIARALQAVDLALIYRATRVFSCHETIEAD